MTKRVEDMTLEELDDFLFPSGPVPDPAEAARFFEEIVGTVIEAYRKCGVELQAPDPEAVKRIAADTRPPSEPFAKTEPEKPKGGE